MKVKRLVAASLLSVYLFTSVPCAFAEEEMNKGMKLTLDYLTASAEKKDAVEGGKEVMKKQFDDWTWNYVVGGYEKLIFQNSEAEIPGFKDKLGKISELMERINNLYTQLKEGKYDQAAFTAIDQAVSMVDHPAVCAIWAAVKLTYESHQLVQQTGAELNIEALYGALDSDRRLRGTSSGNGPKLFNTDKQTVDYFFNKYLITDDGRREMVKSYVQVRLKEKFPEAGTISRFSGWVFGTDSAREDELAELEKFKDVSHRWIETLLNDLNNQVMVEYNRVRAEQEIAAFQKFAAGFKYLNLSVEDILREYKDIKAYKEDAKNFPKYLSDSQTKRTAIEQQYAKISKNSYRALNTLIEAAQPVVSNIYNGRIKARAIKMTDFENSFNAEIELWNILSKKISNDMSNITAQEAKAEVTTAPSGAVADSQFVSFYNSYFASLLVEYEWKNNFESKNIEVIDALNQGDFKKAYEIVAKVENEETSELIAHYAEIYTPAGNIYKKNYDSFYQAYQALNARVAAQGYGTSDIYRQMDYYSNSMKYIESAYHAFITSVNDLNNSQFHKLNENIGLMSGAINEYSALSQARATELANYRQALKGIYTNLPIRTAWINGEPLFDLRHETSLEYQNLEQLYNFFKENRYTSFGKSTSTSLRSYPGELSSRALEIEQMANQLVPVADTVQNEVPLVIKRWELGVKAWKEIKLPEPSEIAEYVVLVDRNFNYDNEFGICAEGVSRVPLLKSKLESMKSELATASDTEYRNRMTDVEFLRLKAKQYDDYLKKITDQGIIAVDSPVTGIPIAKDRNFSGEYRLNLNVDPATGLVVIQSPYPHIAMKNELKTMPELEKVRADFKAQPFYAFVQGNAPQITEQFNKLFNGDLTPAATEKNLVFGAVKPENIVLESQVTAAEKLINNISIADGASYYKGMRELSLAIPKVVRIVSAADLKEQIENEKDPIKKAGMYSDRADDNGTMYLIDETNLTSLPLGKRFMDIRVKAAGLIEKRKNYIIKKREEESEAYYRQEKINYFTQEINKIKTEANTTSVNLTESDLDILYTKLFTLKGNYIAQKINDFGLDSLFSSTESLIIAAKEKKQQSGVQQANQVKDFYTGFKNAYESKNEGLVVSCLSNEWGAGDGTDISEMETNLRRIFNIFDAVSYNIANLNIVSMGNNTYKVGYDLVIIGNIYDRNLQHEEKSSVTEEVYVDSKGKIKINKTITGNFWYIK